MKERFFGPIFIARLELLENNVSGTGIVVRIHTKGD